MQRRRRLRDERPLRGWHAHLRRLPRQADLLRRPGGRVRRLDHALDRDRRRGAGKHLARTRRRSTRRGCSSRASGVYDGGARNEAVVELIAANIRLPRTGDRRSQRGRRRRRDRRAARRSRPASATALDLVSIAFERDPRARRADRPRRARADPERRLPRRGRDRRGRADRRPDPDRGRRHGRTTTRCTPTSRACAPQARRAGQLLDRRAAVRVQDRRPRDHEPVGPVERRLLSRRSRSTIPPGTVFSAEPPAPTGWYYEGVGVRERPRSGRRSRRSCPDRLSRRQLREPVGRYIVGTERATASSSCWPSRTSAAGAAARTGRRERADRDDRRRHLQLPGRGGRGALPRPRRALRAERRRRTGAPAGTAAASASSASTGCTARATRTATAASAARQPPAVGTRRRRRARTTTSSTSAQERTSCATDGFRASRSSRR